MTNHDYIDKMTDAQLIAMHEEVMGVKCAKKVKRGTDYADGRELIFYEYGWEAEEETEKRAIETEYIYSDYGKISSSDVATSSDDELNFMFFMVKTFGQR